MPTWLINLLISLAIKFGMPYLIKRFPWLPAEIWALVEDLLKHIHGSDDKPAAIAKAKEVLRRECFGPGCPMDLKHEE